ncbi:MAG: ABC transporter permease [Trebonia sp.]|jgi:ABC-2 type transport system permease protein
MSNANKQDNPAVATAAAGPDSAFASPSTPAALATSPTATVLISASSNQEVPTGGRHFPITRFLRSELRITFFRRRNQLLLLVAALFPLLIGIGLKAAAPHGGGGSGPGSGGAAFFNQLAGNGVFLTFIALSLLLILVLPVVVAVVAGDSIAGEAGYGTLRYLLTVPAGRTRLLLVKYAMIVVWCVAAVFIVSAVALAVGAVLFPVGPVTLLSGTTVSIASGLIRVLWVTLYICAAMAAVGAIGLAISTFTEHAIGAIAALMILIVASEVVDNIPQFASVAPYLPTHWWNSFDALLRSPIDTTTLWHGLLSFLIYAVIFVLIAWARFTSSDVTS